MINKKQIVLCFFLLLQTLVALFRFETTAGTYDNLIFIYDRLTGQSKLLYIVQSAPLLEYERPWLVHGTTFILYGSILAVIVLIVHSLIKENHKKESEIKASNIKEYKK